MVSTLQIKYSARLNTIQILTNRMRMPTKEPLVSMAITAVLEI